MGQSYWGNRQNEDTGIKSGVKIWIKGQILSRVFQNKGKAIEYLEKQGYSKAEISNVKFLTT